jgi:SnoaL-like domain
VEIVTRHFRTIVRVLTIYWSNPRSFSAATESGELDPEEREVLDCLHPDARWRNVIGEIREGKLGCARGLDELLRASRDYAVRLEEVGDLADDQVLVVLRSSMTGQSSGLPGEISLFTLVALREGLIAEIAEYLSREEALNAAGPHQ